MSAPQMMVHITDAMRIATGELAVRAKKHPARLPPLKQLLIYVAACCVLAYKHCDHHLTQFGV